MNDSGFLIIENVVTAEECDALALELSTTINARRRAGARHLMSNNSVAELAADSRLVSIARTTLGESAVPFKATLFDKWSETNWHVVWHQDIALPVESRFDSDDWIAWSTKAGVHYANAPTWALNRIVALRVHLDSSTNENGPLRVIPGTHQEGALTYKPLFDIARTRNSEECEVRRGGVLAMRPLLIHSSSKARTGAPRRVIHIEYTDSLQLKPGIRLAVA